MTTPMQRSPVHNGVQTRLPPVRNWLELIRLKLSAKSPFAFSKSKGLESLRTLTRVGSKPVGIGSAPVVSPSDLEVDAANASRSCSSNSQIVTDETLKVSEINFAADKQKRTVLIKCMNTAGSRLRNLPGSGVAGQMRPAAKLRNKRLSKTARL